MKKVFLLIALCATLMPSCKSVKVQGEITSLNYYKNGISMGVHASGKGEYDVKMDSLIRGYPVMFAGQEIRIAHTDSTIDIYGTLNLKYR